MKDLEPDSPIWHAIKRGLETFAVKTPVPTVYANPILMADRLADGELPDAATLAWWQIGFQRWRRGDGTLEVCLRLTGSSRIRARNAALIRAAGLIDNGQGNSPWQLAELLRKAVVRFRDVTLERIQRGDAGELSPLQSALADAFASGALPLTSRQRLYGVLSNSRYE